MTLSLPIRHDRPVNGRYFGGVLMYVANNLVFLHKKNIQSNHFEHIWVDVRVNAFYRPPNELLADHQNFLEFAENILDKLSNYASAKYKVIASDLNFGNCYSKCPILNPKPLDSVAPDVFSSHGLSS